MSDIDIKVKMGDGTRSGAVRLDDGTMVSELLKMVIEKWNLSTSTSFDVTNETRGNTNLQFNRSLAAQGVQAGDDILVSAQAVGG